jgi:hypothetical protein
MKYKELIKKTSRDEKYKITFKKINGDLRILKGSRPNLTKDERSALGYNLEQAGNVIFMDEDINMYRTVKAANVISIKKF